jgi:hypothetical protein
MWKVWLAMLAVGCPAPADFLRAVDDSVQLRLFLRVMSHRQLPSERRIKGFARTSEVLVVPDPFDVTDAYLAEATSGED